MDDSQPALALVDGRIASGLPLDDRGFAYGDGLFETVLIHAGEPVWWREHLQRLRRGAHRLGIAAPADADWDADLATLLGASARPARALVKLILTRGSSSRGYAPPAQACPRRVTLRLAAPDLGASAGESGIRVRWCDLRLAPQPVLAGIKHLNRLEQVLARAEWSDPSIAEGLFLDAAGQVVCATSANVVVVSGTRLLTPPVTRCGVEGVCREYLLNSAMLEIDDLAPATLLAADELFLCSSVRGILPVVALGDRQWPIGPVTRNLMQRLAEAQPAFAGSVD